MKDKELYKTNALRKSIRFRSIVVEQVRSGMLTIGQVCQKYRIGYQQFRKWNRWYYKSRILRFHQPISTNPISAKSMKKDWQKQAQQLAQQLAQAQAKIKDLSLQNQALNTAIDLAEEQLNVSIRKKSGTKP